MYCNGFLYRCFAEKQWADDFAAGKMRLPSISAVRNKASAVGRDPLEGTTTYDPGNYSGPTDAEEAKIKMKRLRFSPEVTDLLERMGSKVSLRGNVIIKEPQNVYQLSFSDRQTAKYGGHGVRIDLPSMFFREVSRQISKTYVITGKAMEYTVIGAREHAEDEPPPQRPGLIKPRGFEDDFEVRMAWTVDFEDPETILWLDCPKLARFCTRI
jgi:hypothetical protein